MVKNKGRVLVVDGVRSARVAVCNAVQKNPELELIGQAGNVEEALYKAGLTQPDIVLFDIEILDAVIADVYQKLQQALPAADIIGTSWQWDEASVRMSMLAGAKGHLLKPVTEDELRQAVEQINKEWSRETDMAAAGKIITLFSTKGGIGKTSLAVNLAVALAATTGSRVGLVDANLQFGDVAMFLNVGPKATLFEVARDIKHLDGRIIPSYITSYNDKVKIICAPVKPEQADLIKAVDFPPLLAIMRRIFRYVVIDTAPGFSEINLTLLEEADQVLAVSALNHLPAVNNVKRSLDTFASLGYPQDKVKVVFTRVKARDLADKDNLQQELPYPVVALLPNDFNRVVAAVNSGVPFVTSQSEAPLSKSVVELAGLFATGGAFRPPASRPGLLAMFKRLFG